MTDFATVNRKIKRENQFFTHQHRFNTTKKFNPKSIKSQFQGETIVRKMLQDWYKSTNQSLKNE